MIALCLTHAGQADANAFERDYLRELKRGGRPEAADVRAQLSWMRRRILTLIGGNWYYETPVILRIGTTDAISLSRDDDDYLLLDLRMPSLSGQPRVRIEDNFFTVGRDHVVDIECAARGRVIRIDYPNGDRFVHQYLDISDEEALRERYGTLVGARSLRDIADFPLTVVEVYERTNDPRLEFSPLTTRLGGIQMTGNWSLRVGVGVHVNVTATDEAMLFME